MQRSNSGTSSNSTSDSAAAATPKEGSAQPDKAGKDFSKGTKDQARKESGNKCVLCGKDTTGEPGPDQSNIDHAIPKSRGGDNTIDNAQNTCRTCNLEKGTKTTQEYMNTKPSQPPPPQAPPPPPEPEPPPPRPPR
jgi:5-methylcytosine-specific restriction endonuclease McrA